MKKLIVILSKWKGKNAFQLLKSQVESNLLGDYEFAYILLINKADNKEELPYIPNVRFIGKKDFSFFGKLKNSAIIDLLKNNIGFLICADDSGDKMNNKVLKYSKLKSIGIAAPQLPDFDIAFKNASLDEGGLFKQINNYLAKIVIV